MRKLKFDINFLESEDSSCLVSMGRTRVLCVATLNKNVPPHINKEESGWLAAEYSMLPRSSRQRVDRERQKSNSRSIEIQRLIARSLRQSVDLKKLAGLNIIIDCDVIEADGGTRTASINGGMVALALLLRKMLKNKEINSNPITKYIGAVSAGMVKGAVAVDLDYEKDSKADSDINIVLTEDGNIVEIQGTSERKTLTKKEFDNIFEIAKKDILTIIKTEKRCIKK